MNTRTPASLASLVLATVAGLSFAPAFAQTTVTAVPAGDLTIQADRLLVQLDSNVQAAAALERQLQTQLSPAQQLVLLRMRQVAAENPESPELAARWRAFADSGGLAGIDVNALVQWVLATAYAEQLEDLRFYAEKVKAINAQKQALRDELERIRVHNCRGNDCPPFQTNARALTTSFGSAFLTREADIAAYHAELEGQLQTIGDDAQLAQLDLQQAMQRQQQTLQTLSNVSKLLHDTAMAIIRKIGG